jgi:hypothetical protein
LIVCSIVYLNDLKIAAGDQPAPMATSRGLTVGFMSASFGTKIFVQEREGQPCALLLSYLHGCLLAGAQPIPIRTEIPIWVVYWVLSRRECACSRRDAVCRNRTTFWET